MMTTFSGRHHFLLPFLWLFALGTPGDQASFHQIATPSDQLIPNQITS